MLYCEIIYIYIKWSRYRPGVAQRVGRGIALLFHDRGTRREWAVSITPQPHFTPGKDPVPILQEAGWAPGPVWTGRKSRPHRDSIPDRPARSQSLYRLSYMYILWKPQGKWCWLKNTLSCTKRAFQQFQYPSPTYVNISTANPVALFLGIYRELVQTVLSAVRTTS